MLFKIMVTKDKHKTGPLSRSNGTLKILDEGNGNPLIRIQGDLLTIDMERFSEALEKALQPQKDYLTDVEYQIYQHGKKLRPMMLILSARLLFGDGDLDEKVIKAAVSLEMLHVATLIHDDIVDDALLRRGLQSVNEAQGTNKAILIGDLQFVQAIRCFIDAIDTEQEMGLAKLVLDTAFRICCGELDELDTDPNWETEVLRERYFEVIERKTAIMFGLACETGAALVKGRTSEARRIGFYGRRIGRAFQIMDDLFDFLHDDTITGKIKGADLIQRRLSLPIIYAMEDLGSDHIVSRIVRGAEASPDELADGIASVKNSTGFSRAYADARHEALDALEYLKPFQRNRYWDALEEIALYTVDRSF